MKICPKCNRKYADETLQFCLEDGVGLLTTKPKTKLSNVILRTALVLLICCILGGLLAAFGWRKWTSSRNDPAVKENVAVGNADNTKSATNNINSNNSVRPVGTVTNSSDAKIESKPSDCHLAATDSIEAAKIKFDPASFEVLPETDKILQNLAKVFKQLPPNCSIEIGNHTDNIGNESANLRLSQARADALKSELIKLGVEATRLTAKGYGSSQPMTLNATGEGRAANRRTEFKLFTK